MLFLKIWMLNELHARLYFLLTFCVSLLQRDLLFQVLRITIKKYFNIFHSYFFYLFVKLQRRDTPEHLLGEGRLKVEHYFRVQIGDIFFFLIFL